MLSPSTLLSQTSPIKKYLWGTYLEEIMKNEKGCKLPPESRSKPEKLVYSCSVEFPSMDLTGVTLYSFNANQLDIVVHVLSCPSSPGSKLTDIEQSLTSFTSFMDQYYMRIRTTKPSIIDNVTSYSITWGNDYDQVDVYAVYGTELMVKLRFYVTVTPKNNETP